MAHVRCRGPSAACAALVVVAALVPVIAGARAIDDDWLPVGDNAVVAVLAHDVLSARTPLVGMPTTLGSEGHDVHHLGPVGFWALAGTERLAGSAPWGVVAGVALVGIASIAAVGWATTRLRSVALTAGALALLVLCARGLGRQVLADPWNPYLALLPLAAALFLAWVVLAGEAVVLPALALAASLAAQLHLLYVPLAATLLCMGVAAVVARGRPKPVLAATAVVLGVVWAFPVWQQLRGRDGNMLAVWRAVRADADPGLGVAFAMRATVRAIGVPPMFARPGGGVPAWDQTPAVPVVVSAVAVVLLLGAGTVVAFRRRDRLAASAGVVAAVALLVVLVTTAQVPHQFLGVAHYRMLQLWPVGAIVWFALLLVAVRMLPPVAERSAAALAVVVLVAAVGTAGFSDSAELEDRRVMAAVVALSVASEPALRDAGPVLVDAHGDLSGYLRYGVFRDLQRRGVDVRVDPGDPYLADHYGAPDGAARLVVVSGDRGVPPVDGAERIAVHRSPTGDDAAERARVRAELRVRLRDAVARLTVGESGVLADIAAGRADVDQLAWDGTLYRLLADGSLDLDESTVARVDRLRRLRFAVEELVFAAYLVPAE